MRKMLQSRLLALLAVAVLAVGLMGAGDSARTRFNQLGHNMMCTCGCSQILLECNHVGCADSDRIRRELSAAIDSGQSDQQILDMFKEKYGPVILAAPTSRGFDRVAWTMPGVVLLLGLAGVSLIVYRWNLRRRSPQTAPAAPADVIDPYEKELRRRAREETDL